MINTIKEEVDELWSNRGRIWTFVKKELKMEFGQSRLGLLWSLLEPAGIILVFATIFPLVIGLDFYTWVLFFIAGFIPHRFLQDGIESTTKSLVENKGILNQVNIKEEVVPISSSLASFIKFSLECVVFFSIIFISGIVPGWLALIFPFLVLSQLLMVMGFGMHLSVSYVETRDIDHILKVFFQALFFLAPIVYRVGKIPEVYRGIYLLNPISRLILLYQESLLHPLGDFVSYIPVLENVLLLLIFSFVVFIIGYTSFKRRKVKFMGKI